MALQKLQLKCPLQASKTSSCEMSGGGYNQKQGKFLLDFQVFSNIF